MDYIDKFSKHKVDFPNFETVPNEEKQTRGYFLQVSRAIWSAYLNNKTAIPSYMADHFDKMRLYGKGRQPKDWYKSYLLGGSTEDDGIMYSDIDSQLVSSKESQKEGWLNVDWEIRSIMPRVKSTVIPVIKNVDYNLKVNIIDRDSGAEEENNKYRMAVKMDWGPLLDQLSIQHGLPTDKDDMVPDNWEDLEMMNEEGFFKPEHAKEVEKILKHTEHLSYWDDSLYPKLINDALDTGYIAAFEDIDKEVCKSKWEYVDPATLIIQYSEHNDFRDSDFVGLIKQYTISQLKQMEPGVPELEWRDLAKTYQGYRKNKKIDDWENTLTKGSYVYDDFSVAVLLSWWIDIEKDKKIKYTTKSGENRYYPYDENIIKKHKKAAKEFITRKRIGYHSKWVLGSDIIIDPGKMHNQPRPNKTKPMLPVFVYKIPYKPVTEVLAPLMNDLQIVSLKYQNALSTAQMGGFAIDVGMLENITDGKKKYSIEGILQMWKQAKILLHQVSESSKYEGGATTPIQYIQGNLQEELQTYITTVDNIMKLVEHYTGLSAVFLGASPAPDQAVKTTQLSYQSTINSLKHIVDGCRFIKQSLGASTQERSRLAMSDKRVKDAYAEVIGESGVEVIMMAAKRGSQYGMKLVARADEDQRMAILENAKESKMKRAQGQAGLNEGEYFQVINMIDEGASLQEISRWMSYKIRKDQERIQKQQQQAIQEQNKGLKELEQVKAQNAAQESQQKTQGNIAEENAKSKNKREEIILEAKLKEKQLALEAQIAESDNIKKSNREYVKMLTELKAKQDAEVND